MYLVLVCPSSVYSFIMLRMPDSDHALECAITLYQYSPY
uniref:Uncharacterized protein n=1 Tax=Arundo donax TaxID=35708 RepID=A0A0A9C3E0_ARUDO